MKALEVENLKVIFPTEAGIVRAVEGIDIHIDEGECVAIVGESGCGKSVTSLAVMKLLTSPPAIVRVDKLVLGGIDIKDLSDKQMQKVRGKDVAMIFQDALTALNPVMSVGKQIDEIFLAHGREHFIDETGKALPYFARKKEAKRRTIEALKLVGISDAELRYRAYPHQLSGGMRQRVLIAMAFACNPHLIIADEPTTALDVTIQAQVLDILKELQRKQKTSLMLITHDLSIVMNMADRIYVMYCGKIVESARTPDCSVSRCTRTRTACSVRSPASTTPASASCRSRPRCPAPCTSRRAAISIPAASTRRSAAGSRCRRWKS